MSRSVNEIQYIVLTFVVIFHLNGMALDGDASLLLKIHIVEHLSLNDLDGIGIFQKPVGKCRLAVVDVCYDAKVSYILH